MEEATVGVRGLPTPRDVQRFTATGRPVDTTSPYRHAADAYSAAETYGASPGSFLPVKFNDDSLISIPVLRTTTTTTTTEEQPKEKEKGLSGFLKRKSAALAGLSDKKVAFTMREVTRREYLAHYAKDDSGRYIGTEPPADDCILNGADKERWRGAGARDGDTNIEQVDERQDKGKAREGGDHHGLDHDNPNVDVGTAGVGQWRNEIQGVERDVVRDVERHDHNQQPAALSSTGVGGTAETGTGIVSGSSGKKRFSLFRGLKGGGGGARDNDDGVIH